MVEDFSCPYPRCGCRDWRPGRGEVGGAARRPPGPCPAASPGGAGRCSWQSDGQLPHLVNIQFWWKTTVSSVAVNTDCKLEESYTHTRTSVRVGTNFTDLQEVEVGELQ